MNNFKVRLLFNQHSAMNNSNQRKPNCVSSIVERTLKSGTRQDIFWRLATTELRGFIKHSFTAFKEFRPRYKDWRRSPIMESYGRITEIKMWRDITNRRKRQGVQASGCIVNQ